MKYLLLSAFLAFPAALAAAPVTPPPPCPPLTPVYGKDGTTILYYWGGCVVPPKGSVRVTHTGEAGGGSAPGKDDNGHGNDAGRHDASNPGKSEGPGEKNH